MSKRSRGHFPEYQSGKQGDNKYDVEGNLTIKGITKPVVLMQPSISRHASNGEKEAIGFDATGVIKRSDFKLDKYVPAVMIT
ncbi:polyisoprenoid-binding protein [Klebsiella aerogenes]|nr:polyisoprenoid-binding protein [Klebsiella aerogenes]